MSTHPDQDFDVAAYELKALQQLAHHPGKKFGYTDVTAQQFKCWQRLFRLNYVSGNTAKVASEDGTYKIFIGALTGEGQRYLEQLQTRAAENKPVRRIAVNLKSTLRWLGIYLAGCATPTVTEWIKRLFAP